MKKICCIFILLILLLPALLYGQDYSGGFGGNILQQKTWTETMAEKWAQVSVNNNPYASVDSYAISIGFFQPHDLATILTCPYETDSEKVRAIFYWITQNIDYDINKFYAKSSISISSSLTRAQADSYACGVYAQAALEKRMGVCEDYASLFKVLCNNVNIKCIKLHGMGKTSDPPANAEYKQNHAWNAVEVDGSWRLIDACWASGYSDNNVTLYTRKFCNYYYFTPPEQFILDHYPSDSAWTLLANPKSKKEFAKAPYVVRYR